MATNKKLKNGEIKFALNDDENDHDHDGDDKKEQGEQAKLHQFKVI